MESTTEISEIQQNLITVFKKHLADYLKIHKKDYFKTLSDKSADNIIKHLMQLPIVTNYFR